MNEIDKNELRELFIEIKHNNKIAYEKLYSKYKKLVYGLIETTEDKPYMILNKDEVDNQDYDVYCYDTSVEVIIDGEQMTLRDAVLNGKITIDDIIAKANYDLSNETITGDMMKDGGSMIY